MKKILGILLALCFVLSVTVGAASAYDKDAKFDHDKKFDRKDVKKFDRHDKKFDRKDVKKFDRHDKKFDRHDKKFTKIIKVWVPGHYEKKVVKNVVYKHHQKIVIKKFIKVWVPGHWIYKEVPVRGHHR